MRKIDLFQIMNILFILILGGCTTQGRLTYLTFERSENLLELKSSMEELKIEGYEGAKQQQFSALKEVRYISKYMVDRPGDPVRRELAVSAIVFLAFASDDGGVRDRCLSRIETLLSDDDDWPLYLQISTVDSIADLVIGKLGFKEKHDGQWMNFGIRSTQREDALGVLIDSFKEQNSELRYHTVGAFGSILKSEPSLDTCPFNICDEDVRKNLEEWEEGREIKTVLPSNADPAAVESGAYGPETKRVPIDEKQEWHEELDELKQIVWKAQEDWLEDSDVSLLNQSRMVRWAGLVQNFSMLPEMEQSFQETSARWAENEDISSLIRQLFKASLERVTLYGVPASKDPVPSKSAYEEVWLQDAEFLETHLDAFVQQQIIRQKSGLLAGKPRPEELFSSGFDNESETLVKREIMLDVLADAFGRGLVLEQADALEKLGASMEKTASLFELAGLVRLTESIFPSIRENNWSPQPLLDALVRGVEASEQLQRKRLFLKAISSGVEEFPEEVNLSLSAVGLDLITRQKVEWTMMNETESL